MAFIQIEIDSIGTLLSELKRTMGSHEPFWFRGHSNSSWSLQPGYQRLKNPPPESVLIKKFKQNANLLVSNVGINKFDWLFYLQHYGVPTRLLDWSESPLYALYFSVIANPKKEGAVWALRPLELNKFTTSIPKTSKFLPSFEDTDLDNYSTESLEASHLDGVLPMAAIATRNNARIQAQLGVFTISHRAKQAIETIGDGSHVTKFRVSPNAKKTILEELRLLGVSKFQLFPELSAAGELIKDALS